MKHNWRLDENGKPDEWAWESGFHNGVYCVDCGKRFCIHCDPNWFELDDCPGSPKRKHKTNADRIRAMTDEELACFICDRISNCVEQYCPGAGTCGIRIGKASGLVEWLKQPAEVE